MRRVTAFIVLAFASVADAQNPPSPGFYFDAQLLWFDSPIKTTDFEYADNGSLDEFAPRFILGYDDSVGARVRWWTYDRSPTIHTYSVYTTESRLSFDVVDLEATTHVRYEFSDFLFSGGARIAVVESSQLLVPQDALTFTETAMGGLTFAGEGRTRLFTCDDWGTSAVYGGRLSLLQADWRGDSYSVTDVADQRVQDERFIVPEVFAGLEAHYGHAFSRLTVEMQDWRGTYIGRYGQTLHDFGFTGFGFDLGFVY